jgi:hypothetical protein
MYWFRITAIDDTGTLATSVMSPVMPPLSFSVGPTEAKGMIEDFMDAGDDFHLLDIRSLVNPGLESANEGIIRFTTWFGTAAGMLAHLGAPSDVPIFLY